MYYYIRYKVLLLLIAGLCNCSVYKLNIQAENKLNQEIDRSQKLSIKESPFKCASSMYKELKNQKKYRTQYLKEIDKLIGQYPNDTLYLIERYDYTCFGCPSSNVEIYINRKFVTYDKKNGSDKYVRKNFKYSIDNEIEYTSPKDYPNYDIVKIKGDIRAGKNLSENAKLYGTEECLDGGHTFYTIIFPKMKFESLYMRCWTWDPW